METPSPDAHDATATPTPTPTPQLPDSLLWNVKQFFALLAVACFITAAVFVLMNASDDREVHKPAWLVIATFLSGAQFGATSVICSALERIERKLHGLPPVV